MLQAATISQYSLLEIASFWSWQLGRREVKPYCYTLYSVEAADGWALGMLCYAAVVKPVTH